MIKKIIFAGTPEISSKLLTDLINLLDPAYTIIACYSQPDRPKGRNQLIEHTAVKKIALKHQIQVMQPKSLKDPKAIKQMQDLAPDLMIVFAYGLILPKEILEIPKLGCINVHTSLLPKWRGAAPVQHAILAGDQITGISIMQMDEGLDTGNILNILECTIDQADTTATLYQKLQPLATKAILTVLENLKNLDIRSIPQDHSFASYAHKIKKEDAKIDWNRSAVEIDRFIRALNPTPIAFTSLDLVNISESLTKDMTTDLKKNTETNIRIWQTKILEDLTSLEYEQIINAAIREYKLQLPVTAGTIIRTSKQGIDVIVGKNTNNKTKEIIRIEKLQLSGSKVLSVVELLNAPKHRNLFMVGNKFNHIKFEN